MSVISSANSPPLFVLARAVRAARDRLAALMDEAMTARYGPPPPMPAHSKRDFPYLRRHGPGEPWHDGEESREMDDVEVQVTIALICAVYL